MLRRFELWDRRADRVVLLSKGMKQKLALARALVHDPESILLDEPTANLDPQTSRDVRELIGELRDRGRTIVVSSHNLDEVERLATRVALISTRLIAIGEPRQLRRDLFGRRLRITLSSPDGESRGAAALAASCGARDVTADDRSISMKLTDPDRDAPAIIAALVSAGISVREAKDEDPPLEDVYLKLLDVDRSSTSTAEIDAVNRERITALIGKELREFRANPSAIHAGRPGHPGVPRSPIRRAGADAAPDRRVARVGSGAAKSSRVRARSTCPASPDLPPAAAAEAFLFQQFLLLFLVAPIVGAVSLAAYSVVGEKQGRTLEPLLTTPLTTVEMLLSKVLAAFLPSLVIEAAGLLVYFLLVNAFAAPVCWGDFHDADRACSSEASVLSQRWRRSRRRSPFHRESTMRAARSRLPS